MKKIIGKYIVLILDCIFSIILKNKSKKTNGIILIRTDGIGDFILWLYSAEKIRENINEKITLICNNSCFELAQNMKYFDEVISIDYNKMKFNLKYKYLFFKKIKKNNYKMLINPIYSRNIISEGLVKNISAKEKIGINSNDTNLSSNLIKICNNFYSKLIKINFNNEMELYRNLDFTNKLLKKKYELKFPKIELKKCERILEEEYCVFFLGASNVNRCLEIEKFINMGEMISENLKIVLCGGKSEETLGKKFIEKIINKKQILNLIGKTTLLETINLIKNSKFIIGNETFSAHLAPLFKVKSICILGGGHFGRFMPYPKELEDLDDPFLPQVIYKTMDCFNCNWYCKYKEVPWKCIKNIEVEKINEIIKSKLIK